MPISDLDRLLAVNNMRSAAGKDLEYYGQLSSQQDDTAARMAQLFNQTTLGASQERGIVDWGRDLIGGALKGFSSFADTGIGMLNSAGSQFGVPDLGKKAFALSLGPAGLAYEALLNKSGKSISDVTKLPEWVASDPTSGVFQVGNVAGQVGSAFLGTAALSRAAKAAEIGLDLIKVGKFATTGADLGAAGIMGGAMQAVADWGQFDKSPNTPGAKMSGAEYLSRIAMGTLTGAVAAPLNPKWGALTNIGFDGIVGAATQGALEGVSYAAADEARRKEIEATALGNIGMGAAMNAAIGLGARGVMKVLGGAEPVVAPPEVPAAAVAAAEAGAPVLPTAEVPAAQVQADTPYAQQEEQLISNVRQWAQNLSPQDLEIWRRSLGADEATPDAIADKMRLDIAEVDPNKTDFARAAEWVDGVLGQDWHPKGSGYIIPEPGAVPAAPEQVVAPAAAPAPAVTPEATPAPVATQQPIAGEPTQGALFSEVAASKVVDGARAIAKEMSVKQIKAFAERKGIAPTEEAVADHLSDPLSLTEHVLESVDDDVRQFMANELGLPDANAKSIVNRLLNEIVKDPKYWDIVAPGEKPLGFIDKLYDAIAEKAVELTRTQKPTVNEAQFTEQQPIAGEPNVQPRPEDVNVSESGQREPIAGEPTAQAIEPSPVQQEEAIPPTSAEGQAPQVSAAGQAPEDLGILAESIFPHVKGGLLTKIDQWSADNTDYTLGVRPENNPIAKAVKANRASLLPAISDMLTDVISKYKLPQGAVDYLGEKGIFSDNSSPFVEASASSYPHHYEESQHLVSYLHTPVDIDPKKLNTRKLKALGGEEGVSRLNQALREVRDRVLVELQSDKYSTITIPDPSERRIMLSPEQKKFKKREYKAQSVMDKMDDVEMHRLQQYINNILPWAESAYGLNDNTMKLLRDAGPLAVAADDSPENVAKFIRFLASDDEDGIRLAYKNRDEVLLADPNANSPAWLGGEQAVDRLRRAFQDIQTDLRMWMGLAEGSSVSKPSQGQASAEATAPITEPIAGEPYATQEGQVTEGGQPEYLGVPQGENVQENVGEVRQEEGGRSGDSGGALEGGQEQVSVAPIQAAAQSLLDMEAQLSSVSEKMSADVRSFFAGEPVSRGLGGKDNPLRPLMQSLEEISGQAVPDAKTLKREAIKTEDGNLVNIVQISKEGVPLAEIYYYKEPGNARAQVTITPSEQLSQAIEASRMATKKQVSEEVYGVDPDIAEMFADYEAIGAEDMIGTEQAPAALAIESKQAKRQRKFAEDKQDRQLMQEVYNSRLDEVAEVHAVSRETVDRGITAYEQALDDGAASETDALESVQWQAYMESLPEDEFESVSSLTFIGDVIEAIETKKQYKLQAEIQASAPPAKAKRKRITTGQSEIRFDEGSAKASLGLAPAFATAGLDDDKEYVFGLKGSTIKQLALAAGGGVFLHNRISKSPMFGLGANVTGAASPRTTWLQLLRNKTGKQKLTRAVIERNTRNWGGVFGLSEESIQAKIAKDWAEHNELESVTFPGMRGITQLKILGKYSNSRLPKRLSEAAYAGRAVGERNSIAANLAQKAYESLPELRAVTLGQMMTDIDYNTTRYLNEQGGYTGSNSWTKAAQDVFAGCESVVNDTVNTSVEALRKTNPKAADELLADWNFMDEKVNDVRRAYFDLQAYVQTGVESLGSGFKKYDKIVKDLSAVQKKHLEDVAALSKGGESIEVLKSKSSALSGLNNQLLAAMKMRNVLGDLRIQRDLSIARRYMPRWFDVNDHEFRVRIKTTATDPGELQSFEDEDKMRAFLEQMNAPLTEETRRVNGVPELHPINQTPLNTLAEFYQSQGGIVEAITNRFELSKLVESSADQMALREALSALADASQDGGEMPAERFKQFLSVYGDDISKMVTASELQDIGVSSGQIDKLTNSRGKISSATIRRLVNAIAVPRNVDSTMHRTNVRGYAPEAIDRVTKQPNDLYNRQMRDFVTNGFNWFLTRSKSQAESASLRKEINAQIIDLTSRGIAPNYVETLGRLSSGLRWKPQPMTMVTGLKVPAAKVDELLASFGAFKMMAGNVPAAVKNVYMGFVNTATQLPFETNGRLDKAIRLGLAGEAAYWKMLTEDKVLRKQFADHLRSPVSLQTVDEQIARELKGNNDLRAVWILARESGAFEAKFYQSLERNLKSGLFDPKRNPKLARAIELGASPQVLAEHHNRGASFMTGAMISLKEVPGDINRAFARGLEFQGMTQGNFSNYNKSVFERKLLEVPGSRSVLLLSNAALRSFEQLAAHFLAAVLRPRQAKVWAPILAFAGSSIIFTGLLGAAITGDAYKAIDYFGSLFAEDDETLNAIKESMPEAWTRKAGETAQSMGLDRNFGEWVMQNMLIGTSSVITGKNFSTENAITNFATQFPPPGLSTPIAFFDYVQKFPGMSREQRFVQGIGLANVEMGRVARSGLQLAKGGKIGKSGDVVTNLYTVPQAIGDVTFGSNLDEALYGTSKRGGGGKIYFPDQANKYLSTVSAISGLSLSDIHYAPFYEKVKGLPEQQARVEATNRFRDLNIVNYDALGPARDRTLGVWRQLVKDPNNRNMLVRIAMEGQQGSKLSNQPAEFLAGAEKKIDNYYLALAVQQSYAQLGIPPPKYKYQGADPMLPVWKYIDSKIRRGQLQFETED